MGAVDFTLIMESKSNPYLAHRDGYQYQSRRKYPVLAFESRSRDYGTASVLIHNEPPQPINPPSNISNKKGRYSHGNYEGYYGYRIGQQGIDSRCMLLDEALFANKKVLDIGCNTGQLTLNIAMHFNPAFIHGVDIDPKLIRKARLHLGQKASLMLPDDTKDERDVGYFPISCLDLFSPLSIVASDQVKSFPQNVKFSVEDWANGQISKNVDEQYDVILAMSVTKWIHLNGGPYLADVGDGGLKYFFRRCAAKLAINGILILEPQEFSGYRKRANLTPQMKRNFENITFTPDKFVDHLKKLGLCLTQTLKGALGSSKGFKRPIYVFQRADLAT